MPRFTSTYTPFNDLLRASVDHDRVKQLEAKVGRHRDTADGARRAHKRTTTHRYGFKLCVLPCKGIYRAAVLVGPTVGVQCRLHYAAQVQVVHSSTS